MIRSCRENDVNVIRQIINDAAQAYKGVIPADCWSDPYMPQAELADEIAAGVRFLGYEQDGELVGVMGAQDVQDVTLIRHAYVRTSHRNRGIGGQLLAQLAEQTKRPLLIGTWADAVWALRFYENRGFRLVGPEEKDPLLIKYWSVPPRQREVSVVLADALWFNESGGSLPTLS